MSEATGHERTLSELVREAVSADQPESEPPDEESAALTDEERAALEGEMRALQEAHQRRVADVRRDARASFRAVAGWGEVETEADWERVCAGAVPALLDGSFLVGRLGAERVLDPTLTATLLALRQGLIEDHQAHGAGEVMLVDLAVLGYYNALRVQGWIGDTALWLEHELFGAQGPTAVLERQYGPGSVKGLTAEERVERIAQQLTPLLDRMNRMLIRNLRALRELRTPGLGMTVQNFGQLNVGQTQANTAAPAPTSRRRRRVDGAH